MQVAPGRQRGAGCHLCILWVTQYTTVLCPCLCVSWQDGDEYMVLWDRDLLPPRESEPMDYKAEKPKEVSHAVAALAGCSCLSESAPPTL